MKSGIEVVPAILRKTYEGIEEHWNQICGVADHVQIDVTDGVFAGDGTFREIRQFKKLKQSEKIELHMMVHTPANFVEDIIDLDPARCVFHVEAFEGTNDIQFVYEKLRQGTSAELGLAVNPDSPNERLEEHLSFLDYVMFLGVTPGFSNQTMNPVVYRKVGQFRDRHSDTPIAVDGGVNRDTIEKHVRAGATILCAASALFQEGDPVENYKQLQLLAEGVE